MPINLYPGENPPLTVQMTPIHVEPDKATLQGLVTNSVTGHGIAGVRVDLSGVGGIYFTYTLTNGTYLIDNIVPGTYTVTFSHAEYETLVI